MKPKGIPSVRRRRLAGTVIASAGILALGLAVAGCASRRPATTATTEDANERITTVESTTESLQQAVEELDRELAQARAETEQAVFESKEAVQRLEMLETVQAEIDHTTFEMRHEIESLNQTIESATRPAPPSTDPGPDSGALGETLEIHRVFNYVFGAPSTLRAEEVGRVQLRASVKVLAAYLTDHVSEGLETTEGTREHFEYRYVSARLIGEDLAKWDIEPDEKSDFVDLDLHEEHSWEWTVTTDRVGRFKLKVLLWGCDNDGGAGAVPLDDLIEVYVSVDPNLAEFVYDVQQGAVGTLTTSAAVWLASCLMGIGAGLLGIRKANTETKKKITSSDRRG